MSLWETIGEALIPGTMEKLAEKKKKKENKVYQDAIRAEMDERIKSGELSASYEEDGEGNVTRKYKNRLDDYEDYDTFQTDRKNKAKKQAKEDRKKLNKGKGNVFQRAYEGAKEMLTGGAAEAPSAPKQNTSNQKIRVRNKETGVVGKISEKYFNAEKYERL